MPTLEAYLTDPALGLVREVRQSQLRMAMAVAQIIEEGGVYTAEGPVGCGKTYAYLLPALLAGKRIVISTPKKSLQDQIMKKDLPALMKALGKTSMDVTCIGVKGKGNYTCRHKAERHSPSAEYQQWQARSPYGDRADYPGPTPPWWSEATAETCIGAACPVRSTCGYVRLRTELQQTLPKTKVIVINHHLLGFDFYYGVGKLVGGAYDVLIVDEAHKLQDGIREAFTLRVSERSANDIAKLIQDTPIYVRNLEGFSAVWEQLFASVPRKHWKEPHERRAPVFDSEAARTALHHLEKLNEELGELLGTDDEGESQLPPEVSVPLDQARRKVGELVSGIRTMQGTPYRATEEDDPEIVDMRNQQYMRNTVIYAQAENRPGRFSVYAAPVHTGNIVSMGLKQIPATVLVSATLAVNGEFRHLLPVIGVEPTRTDVLPPSFDYGKQGILYVPKHVPYRGRPQPDDEEAADLYAGYLGAMAEECAFLVNQSKGNAFILTTANDEMELITERLRPRTSQPIFMQEFKRRDGTLVGDGPPEAILRKYMETDGAVLVGSKSFWEGVDVQGEKLCLVIIPKLPFPTRHDPIVEARRKATTDAFKNVDLVDMLIDLRQGTGRLIRSASDRGVVAILDARIWDRKGGLKNGAPTRYSSYGKTVVNSLPFPPNVITHERQHVSWYLPRVKLYFEKLRAAAV